jgi:hypothetical protein
VFASGKVLRENQVSQALRESHGLVHGKVLRACRPVKASAANIAHSMYPAIAG